MSWRNAVRGGVGLAALLAAGLLWAEESPSVGPEPESGPQLYRARSFPHPHGEHIQSWERGDDGQGPELHQQWMAPDGTTVRREHTLQFSRDEAGNYERYHRLTLPHNRYLEQTWTYNAETGTLERTFHGPNGQTWSRTQGEPAATAPGPASGEFANRPPAVREGMAPSAPHQERAGWGWGRFFREFNPFAKPSASSPQPSVRTGRPGGFTVGTGASARGIDRPTPPRVTPAAAALGGHAAGPRERPAHAAARPVNLPPSHERSLPSAAAARNR